MWKAGDTELRGPEEVEAISERVRSISFRAVSYFPEVRSLPSWNWLILAGVSSLGVRVCSWSPVGWGLLEGAMTFPA